jgi:chromosome segregation ATPase
MSFFRNWKRAQAQTRELVDDAEVDAALTNASKSELPTEMLALRTELASTQERLAKAKCDVRIRDEELAALNECSESEIGSLRKRISFLQKDIKAMQDEEESYRESRNRKWAAREKEHERQHRLMAEEHQLRQASLRRSLDRAERARDEAECKVESDRKEIKLLLLDLKSVQGMRDDYKREVERHKKDLRALEEKSKQKESYFSMTIDTLETELCQTRQELRKQQKKQSTELAKHERMINALNKAYRLDQEQIAELEEKLKSSTGELESLKAFLVKQLEHSRRASGTRSMALKDLCAHYEEMQRNQQIFTNFFGSSFTPKMLWMILELLKTYQPHTLTGMLKVSDLGEPFDAARMNLRIPKKLLPSVLEKIQQWHEVFPSTTCATSWGYCDLCKLPRLTEHPTSREDKSGDRWDRHAYPYYNNVVDFLPGLGFTACCKKHVCNYCLKQHLMKSMQEDWWQNLSSEEWIHCPAPQCDSVMTLSKGRRKPGNMLNLDSPSNAIELFKWLGFEGYDTERYFAMSVTMLLVRSEGLTISC